MPAVHGATLHGAGTSQELEEVPVASRGRSRVPEGVLSRRTGKTLRVLGKLSSLMETLGIVRPMHWSSWSAPTQFRYGSFILVHVWLWWNPGQGGAAGR